MLTTARPIFENVPASFADPVALADQQAPGIVSLIVVRYDPGDGLEHDALGPCYDSYVAVSGQLLAVARTTADYRYPVTPSVGLARFIEHREAGRPAFVSVYELDEEACARFVETVFFSECLKLHVAGADSAPLVARQIARSGCGNGVLEVNDFSDPAAPRIRLLDLDGLAAAVGTDAEATDLEPPPDDPCPEPAVADPAPLTDELRRVLDGVDGRVLLYDRPKNMATVRDRAGQPFDLGAAVEEANRLAIARRGADPDQAARQAHLAAAELRATAPDDQLERVEDYLRGQATRPHLVAPQHPHAHSLGALVAELQGRGPNAPPDGLEDTRDAPSIDPAAGDGATAPAVVEVPANAPGAPSPHVTTAPAPAPTSTGTPATAPSLPPSPANRQVGAASGASVIPLPPSPTGANPPARHVLATELDVLRAEAFALFEEAVGREHAVAHEAHVLEEHQIPSPVPSDRTLDYLRALLCDAPPRRWHFFKRSRGKTYPVVCAKLLAFHSANAHVDDPVVHEVSRLWSRLHK